MLTFITISRLLLALIAIPLLQARTPQSLSWALACVLSIEATDFLDGRIARRHKMVSEQGKLLDPLMDSLARFTLFATLLAMGLAPLWMVLLFFYRDMLVAYLRSFASTYGVVMAARVSGKVKAVVQGVVLASVTALLLADSIALAGPDLSAFEVFVPCVLTAVLTGGLIVYFRLWAPVMWLVAVVAVVVFACLGWLWVTRPVIPMVRDLVWWLLLLAAMTTVWSLSDYVRAGLRVARQGRAS